jgi:anti-sigma regulatory factor (Ser/Thr protein kinase)/predicted small secreted protein
MTTSPDRATVPRRSIPSTIVLAVAFLVAGCGTVVSVDAEDVRDTPSALSSVAADGSLGVSPAPAGQASAATEPSPSAARARPIPASPPSATPEPPRTRFAMDLYRKGDYVAQYTFEWCVGASLQMALNMTTAANSTTRAHQEQLWEMAQARSTSPFGGANPRGWTAALNDLGIGPYVLVSLPDLDLALQVAARALRETKRPVGLVMWRGRHAWVMSGFHATGDPLTGDVRVTAAIIEDPLYPRDSRTWGPSPAPGQALVARADRRALEQILSNLIDNAIKYSPDGGEVNIKLEAHDTDVILTVRDRGIGIPGADQSRIFERFQRGTNVEGRFQGTGIGLAGARQIVEQHGGAITVKSQVAKGSTFTVRFPAGSEPAKAQAA